MTVGQREKTEGVITGLYICREKGQPPSLVSELKLLAGLGIEGDIHAKGGAKQVSMLSQEVADWMEVQENPGLCFKRYKANIRIKGISLSLLTVGTRLSIGSAVLSVSESEKKCFTECHLFSSGGYCALSRGGLFLKIEGTGHIRKDDKIVIIA